MASITKKIIKRMVAAGVDTNSHHATIRSEYKNASGSDDKLSKDDIQKIRDMLWSNGDSPASTQQAGTPEPSEDELLSLAEQFVKTEAKSKDSVYRNVLRVVSATTSGRPSRVIISCQDPQANGSGDIVCEETREVAIQDLHQVTRCGACQRRYVQIYRNRLARERRAELRKHREDKPKRKARSKKS